jgi:hypothetical protein
VQRTVKAAKPWDGIFNPENAKGHTEQILTVQVQAYIVGVYACYTCMRALPYLLSSLIAVQDYIVTGGLVMLVALVETVTFGYLLLLFFT